MSQFRNVQDLICTSGQETWIDLPRNSIKIDGQHANFLQAITAYKTKNDLPKNNEYRKVLHGILNSKFQKILNLNISGPLIDECVTMLNQESLCGASTHLSYSLAKDIQYRMRTNAEIMPTIDASETNIKTISESDLTIYHKEDFIFRDSINGTPISTVSITIRLNINANTDGTLTYSNTKISLKVPQDTASSVLPIRLIRMANMLVPLRNLIGRIQSFFTGSTFYKVTPYKITRTPDLCIIEHKLPDYTCSPVALPEIEDKKEKRQQKQQSLYQTRSTFTPPKHSNSSNKDSNQHNKLVSVIIHNPEIQPKKEPKTQSHSS
ncbi:hypothetical protein EHF_0753 [Ehrlichia japonica]|uniref:Uncharacterized protein n=1 Tax=Ehrlichia japonica TaxID=391036 RepID=X5H0X8_9RICK|nr:hypothetical protein EHF_0753 [Ehrlichia japonica]